MLQWSSGSVSEPAQRDWNAWPIMYASEVAVAGKQPFGEGLEWHADYGGFRHSSNTVDETRSTGPVASCIVRRLSLECLVRDSPLSEI